MTDPVALAIVAAIPPTLAALAALLVSIRNSRKADVIVGHVNSSASAATAKIEGLQAQVADLIKSRSDDKETAALLAQAVVIADATINRTKEN
jgi:hypothetical protein